MRLLVFFDLPIKTEVDTQIYRKFRNDLLKQGYKMMQYSIYSKICVNDDASNYYIEKIKKLTPKKGHIRILKLTEKQYSKMIIICGGKTQDEDKITDKRLLIF